jgi:response regulator of citrate/malate metabolism
MSSTIMIIEDNNDFAESVKIKIEEEGIKALVRIEGFKAGMEQLSQIGPDVLVLDIFEGLPQDGKKEGVPIFQKQVWGQYFTPVIFASASRETDLMEFSETHPLLHYIVKVEEDVVHKIVEHIKKFLPFGEGINKIRTTILSDTKKITQQALTETAPHTLLGSLNPDDHIALLESATRRRLAALLRLKSEEENKPIFAWEQYLYPSPITSHLLTGDVLVSTAENTLDPCNYRVVLSPSCDLAQCNIEAVLVGKCVPLKDRFSKIQFSKVRGKAKNSLSSILTHAQLDGYVVLPAYSNLIPSLAVSLRDLELLEIKEAATGRIKVVSSDETESEFIRVASIDSPFREQIAWAYLEIACRPGIPDRNMDAWTNEILDHLAQKDKGKDD